jgi:methyl-accepting chemotaxis protein
MVVYTKNFIPSFYLPLISINIPILLAVVVISSIYLNNTIFKPISSFVDINEHLANGELNLMVKDIDKNDEIGRLNRSMKKTLTYLKSTISEITSVSKYLSSSSKEISSISEEVNSTSQEITAISQEMAGSANILSENIQEMINFTESLKSEFENKFQSIMRASEIIESISNQVNLLALNASIEAARAGEYGRGFAVVADNIRQLSSDTKNSVIEVNSTVSELQNFLRNSISELNTSAQSISSIAEKNSSGATETSAATEQQAATMQELNSGAQELSNTSIRLNKLIEQFKV